MFIGSFAARPAPRSHHRSPMAAAVACAGLLLAAASAGAQQPPASPFTAGWNNGFALQTADGSNRLQIGTVIQLDGRFSVNDPLPITNTFTIRKVAVVRHGIRRQRVGM